MLQRARDMSGPFQNGVVFSHHRVSFSFLKKCQMAFPNPSSEGESVGIFQNV